MFDPTLTPLMLELVRIAVSERVLVVPFRVNKGTSFSSRLEKNLAFSSVQKQLAPLMSAFVHEPIAESSFSSTRNWLW
jgi:hypothetical protein